MKISVIGDHSTAVGFKLVGVNEAIEVESPKDALVALKELMKDKEAGLIIITERLSRAIAADIKRMTEKRVAPLVVSIPDSKGFAEERIDLIKDIIRRAIGVDIKY